MFTFNDEVISTKLFKATSNTEYTSNIFQDFLTKFDGKTITTLSGKKVTIRTEFVAGDLRIHAGDITVYTAECEFQKFCDCFPYNQSITFPDIYAIVNTPTKFKNGVMAPAKLMSQPVDDKAIKELELFYSMVLV